MQKEQLLSELSKAAAAGEITRGDVMAVFAEAPNSSPAAKHLSISEIMYYIGGAIVFLGIIVLGSQNWDSFNSPLRILITLGSAVAAFIVASLLNNNQNLGKVSQAFFLLAGLLAPLGLTVLFKEIGLDVTADSLEVLIYLLLTAIFFSSLSFFRRTVILLFGILFASILFHFVINLIVGQNLLTANYSKVWEYSILATGLAWMCLGYYFKDGFYKALTGTLYGFGVLGFLGATIALGGWQPNQNAFWELIYPLLVFGVIFLSVYVKSKSFLVFGTIFLIGYILKLTSEYFSSGLGWPLALVLAGLAIMAIGYYAVRINKKYFTAASEK